MEEKIFVLFSLKKVLYASMHSNVLAWPNRDHCADIRSFKNLKFEERKQTKKSSSAFLRFLHLFFIPGPSIFLAIVKIQNILIGRREKLHYSGMEIALV